jgi:hypothetical protein
MVGQTVKTGTLAAACAGLVVAWTVTSSAEPQLASPADGKAMIERAIEALKASDFAHTYLWASPHVPIPQHPKGNISPKHQAPLRSVGSPLLVDCLAPWWLTDLAKYSHFVTARVRW